MPTPATVAPAAEVIDSTIQTLLNENKVSDLKRFLYRRDCLNCTNIFLMYTFHIVQTSGILTTTIAAGYDMREIVWVGAALNALAALIHVFERLNLSLIRQYAKDIHQIRINEYEDEEATDVEDKTKPEKL